MASVGSLYSPPAQRNRRDSREFGEQHLVAFNGIRNDTTGTGDLGLCSAYSPARHGVDPRRQRNPMQFSCPTFRSHESLYNEYQLIEHFLRYRCG